MEEKNSTIPFFTSDTKKILTDLGKELALSLLAKMITIRQFDLRAEASYLQGKVGGFLHLYIGQEAIQTAAVQAAGTKNWFSTSYRCHGLALLLGESPLSLMSELYGKETGNAHGRGGSMHFFLPNMLGGDGIVGGQLPMATGAGFTCKYLKQKEKVSLCFLGDGAVAQGTFHESLNLASLRKLPCLYIVENNKWSMGTPLIRTLCDPENFLFHAAQTYNMPYYRLDGMDIFNCYAGFKDALDTVINKETPVLIECLTDRFKGHSISDPGLYRTKDELKECMKRDPILLMKNVLIENQFLTDEEFKVMETKIRQEIAHVAEEADKAPWPDPSTLEQGVLIKE